MGLEEMLASIRADAEAQSSKIISDAKSQAEKLLSDARQKAQTIVAQGRAESEKEASEDTLRSVASARLEAKRKLLESKDRVLKNYLSQAEGYLQEFVRKGEYKNFLLKMVSDGVSKIGEDAVVSLNSHDRSLLQNPGSDNFQIASEPIDCTGGAIVSSGDGKRRVDNTIEAIFEERKENLRLKLADRLFGKR